MRYSVNDDRPYKEAVDLVESLKKEGIDASITAGGIGIYPENDKQIKRMNELCKERGFGEAKEGGTEHQKEVVSAVENIRNRK